MAGTIHGHYGSYLDKEAKRIKAEYKDKLGININWREATDIAALRSLESFWDEKKAKQILSRLRGVV